MLVIAWHRGHLNVPEWVASHQSGDLQETLLDIGEEDIPVLEAIHNVVEVTPAPVGWFTDDGFGAVLVHEDGTWESDEE